jgi:hypothetical protein
MPAAKRVQKKPVALQGSGDRLTNVASDPDVLTKEQLAAKLSFASTRMVDELMRKRKIPFYRWGHRTVRFSWRRCQEALAKFEIKAVGQ